MRELKGHEIGQVAGAKNGSSSAGWSQLTSANTGAWTAHFTYAKTVPGTAQFTSVSKTLPVVNEIAKTISNLFGINIPFLNL